MTHEFFLDAYSMCRGRVKIQTSALGRKQTATHQKHPIDPGQTRLKPSPYSAHLTTTKAQQQAYELTKKISWDKVYYRTDIGYRAAAREK